MDRTVSVIGVSYGRTGRACAPEVAVETNVACTILGDSGLIVLPLMSVLLKCSKAVYVVELEGTVGNTDECARSVTRNGNVFANEAVFDGGNGDRGAGVVTNESSGGMLMFNVSVVNAKVLNGSSSGYVAEETATVVVSCFSLGILELETVNNVTVTV